MSNVHYKLRNTIVYLFGVPAVGKYTIAKEIHTLTGARLVDNQLINIPVFSILGYTGKDDFQFPRSAWKHISTIRKAVMDTVRECSSPDDSFVFTNVLRHGDLGSEQQFGQLLELAESRRATFVPVRVVADFDDIRHRKDSVDRRMRYKDTDLNNILEYENNFEVFRPNHCNSLEINTSRLSILESADRILAHVAELTGDIS